MYYWILKINVFRDIRACLAFFIYRFCLFFAGKRQRKSTKNLTKTCNGKLSQKILNVKKEGRGRTGLNFGFKGEIPTDSILSYFLNCIWRKRSLPFYSTKSNLKFSLYFVLEICGMLISNCWLVKNLLLYFEKKSHMINQKSRAQSEFLQIIYDYLQCSKIVWFFKIHYMIYHIWLIM